MATNRNNVCVFEFGALDYTLITQLFGLCESTVGLLLTAVIIFTFCTFPKQSPYRTLLQILAFLDTGVLITYILMFPLNSLSEYYRFLPGYNAYVNTIPYTYPLGRWFQMSSTYIVITVALERYSSLMENRSFHSSCFRGFKVYYWFLGTCLLSLISHISRYFEITINVNDNCTSDAFGYYYVSQANWVMQSELYRVGFVLWYTNLINMVLPFCVLIILLCLNLYIYSKSSSENDKNVRALMMRFSVRAKTARLRLDARSSVRTLLVVVSFQLLFNAVPLMISIWEFIDRNGLTSLSVLYTLSVEVINLSAVTNATIRLIIYYCLNMEFHKQLDRICRKRRAQTDKNDNELIGAFKTTTNEGNALYPLTSQNSVEADGLMKNIADEN